MLLLRTVPRELTPLEQEEVAEMVNAIERYKIAAASSPTGGAWTNKVRAEQHKFQHKLWIYLAERGLSEATWAERCSGRQRRVKFGRDGIKIIID